MATTLATYVTALEQTWTGLADAVTGLTDEQWHAPTDLAGWTVKDNVSHVVGVELILLGEPFPEHPLPGGLAHVRDDFAVWTETPVDLRRPLPGEAVLAELRDVTERRLKALAEYDDAALETEVPGLFGAPIVLKHLLGIRVFDCWTHEQDVRRALGRPGDLTTTAAQVARRRLLLGLTRVDAGRTVVFETTGALPSVASVTFGGGYAEGDSGETAARITTDWETFFRLGTGRCRWPVDGVTVSGDAAFAEDVLRRMAVTP